MPPPAKKKRKTNDGAAVVGTRRTTRSQRPLLSIEMIGKVGSFADYDNGDLMNICVAVGPKDVKIVRHVCLRNNMRYLRRVTRKNLPEGDLEKTKEELSTWMEINTHWRQLCKLERANNDFLCSAKVMEDGKEMVRTNPFILLNNPAVAIELGRVDILQHLVENIGIDINAYHWSGYTSLTKYHLLAMAAIDDKACFDYLIARPGVDLRVSVQGFESLQVWQYAFVMIGEHMAEVFKAMVHHEGFPLNCPIELLHNENVMLPLHFAITACVVLHENDKCEDTEQRIGKYKVLLDAGADLRLSIPPAGTPLEAVKKHLLAYGEDPEKAQICQRLIAMMEEKIAEM